MLTRDIKIFYSRLKKFRPILCLDYGIRKSGVAISDPDWNISMPLSVVDTDSSEILHMISVHNATGLVIGLPINMNGTENCPYVIKFASQFGETTNTLLFDERLTSKLANRILTGMGLSRKKRTVIDHKIAASLILETALGSMRTMLKSSSAEDDLR